jgi:hypothetical protein
LGPGGNGAGLTLVVLPISVPIMGANALAVGVLKRTWVRCGEVELAPQYRPANRTGVPGGRFNVARLELNLPPPRGANKCCPAPSIATPARVSRVPALGSKVDWVLVAARKSLSGPLDTLPVPSY